MASNLTNSNLKTKIQFRDFCNANKEKFHEEIASLSWTEILNDESLDQNTNKFLDVLYRIYNKCFPVKT